MAKSSEAKQFSINSFLKGRDEAEDKTINVPVDPTEPQESNDAPKKRSRKKTEEPIVAQPVAVPMNSMSYVQNNVPYDMAYSETKRQLDETIGQLDSLGMDVMTDLQMVRANKSLKSKFMIMGNMTENAVGILNAKLNAIKEKNKITSDIQNLEIKRIKDLRMSTNEQDDNQRIADLYSAFINTPIGGGPMTAHLAPSVQSMAMIGGTGDLPRIAIGPGGTDEVAAWQQGLSPAQNRMLLQAQGRLDIVVIYDESTGSRRFAALDKNTRQEVPNVELPSQDTVWELDLKLHTGNPPFAKDVNRGAIYPVIIVNGGNEGSMSQY